MGLRSQLTPPPQIPHLPTLPQTPANVPYNRDVTSGDKNQWLLTDRQTDSNLQQTYRYTQINGRAEGQTESLALTDKLDPRKKHRQISID